MRKSVRKNLDAYLPDSIIPVVLMSKEGFNKERFKKRLWNSLNWKVRSEVTKNFKKKNSEKISNVNN
jgi:hypothetical protein